MKFMIYPLAVLLALCLVLQSSSATYSSSEQKLNNEAMAVIEELQSAIEGLEDIGLNSAKNTKLIKALMQISPTDDDDDDDDEANIQQQLSSILQLQLALRDLIRVIARLERSIRQGRRR